MKILVVDDERSIRLSIVMSIKKLGIDVSEASDGIEAMEMFRKNKFDLVFLDINMPGLDGIEVLRQMKQLDKQCIVIMMTHLSEVRLAVEAMKLGAYEYFTKPFSVEELIDIVKNTKTYIDEFKVNDFVDNQMIGASKEIQNIYKIVDKLSNIKASTSVLIYGESGTGKEMVAKQIAEKCTVNHEYVAINCAAIPMHLQESELFGHEKGAFSDAKEKRVGLFEHAKDGVLFLDEIGDMNIDLQAKLLRVLQERTFRRIGGNVEIPFKAFVVAASNKRLIDEVQKGNFRKDLYYRLNIIPITVPPLRERKEDLEVLATHFIAHYNALFGKSIQCITPELMKRFKAYDWPGNVRELRNIIERLMILNDSDCLNSEELPYELANDSEGDTGKLSHLEVAEQEAVLRALSTYSWNITKAASQLGISRLTLRRKIDKYGLKK